jgi:cytoskeletal protein RodZ
MQSCKQPKKECPWNYKLIMSLVTVIVLIVSGIITAHAITIRAVARNETKSAQNEKDLTRHEETILRNESKTDRAIEATRTD